jgi:hypothetical protein
MYIGIKSWKNGDWVSFALVFLFLGLHLIIAGFPIIDWDSIRYLLISSDPYSLPLMPYLLRPFGVWGFAIFQIVILTYTLVMALKFFNKSFIIGIISICLSAAGYFAIQVMMDTYTAVGLLALFLILNGNKDIFLYIILSVCYIAHPENLLLFPLCALMYWLIFDRRNFNFTLRPVIIAFIIPVIGSVLMNYWSEKDSRFLPKEKYIMLATYIMADSPEITRSYMEEYPGSEISQHRQFYEYALTKSNPYHILMWDSWDRKEGFNWNEKIRKEAKGFLLFALKNYKFKLLNNSIKNTFYSLIRPGEYVDTMHLTKEPIDTYLPNQLKYAKDSLQYKGKLSSLSRKLRLIYMTTYYTSILVILFFILFSFINPKARNPKYYPFAIFAIIIILVNACIMANFIGIYLRLQLRVMLIPCLAISLIIADLFKRHMRCHVS